MVDFLPCGDTGLSVQFGDAIERPLSERILRIKAAIDAAHVTGIVETVPTYRALMIHYDPLQTGQDSLIEAIGPLLDHPPEAPIKGNRWRFPVCYEPEFAPDLADVAKWAGMAPERVVEINNATSHYVYMLGFAPGQPYMGELPAELAIPRREDPRGRIEKGSIVTATGMTIIYPVANASGWHVIGRTPIDIFDMRKDPPILLKPGDTVTFHAVSAAEFKDIAERVAAGRYPLAAGEEGR
jgi:KipI family sensor histidine kinase inhibitor